MILITHSRFGISQLEYLCIAILREQSQNWSNCDVRRNKCLVKTELKGSFGSSFWNRINVHPRFLENFFPSIYDDLLMFGSDFNFLS